MAFAKNWTVLLMASIGGFELIVKGQVNVGDAITNPSLIKRDNPGLSKILKLDLIGVANTSVNEHFKRIQFDLKVFKRISYNSVEIFHEGIMIANVVITKL